MVASNITLRGDRLFQHGVALDRFFETTAGVIWVTSLVEVEGQTLVLRHLLFYPTTGKFLRVGVRETLEIVRQLEREARAEGFREYTLDAVRRYDKKPERMINMSRRLR